MSEILNPYEAGRNIYGRWGLMHMQPRGGAQKWMATVTEVSYTVEIDRMDVRRAGTRWVDYKEGEFTGSGSFTLDYVNSDETTRFINYVNGKDPDGVALSQSQRRLPVYSIQVNLEDDQTPGIVKDENGFATAGHESVILNNVKFWNLEGGYGGDMISRSYEFTFKGIENPHQIVDPLNPEVD